MKRTIFLLLMALPALAFGDIRYRSEDPTSVIEDSVCVASKTTPETFLHVDEDVSGLIVNIVGADGTSVGLYDAGAELEDIAVLGTYAAPSANNVRVSPDTLGGDCTQLMFADSVYAGQSHVVIRISDGGTTIMDFDRYVYLDGLTSDDLGLLYKSDIGTVNSQIDFDNDETISTANVMIGSMITIEDATNGDTSVRWVTDVTAANNNVTIDSAPDFTAVANDKIRIFAEQHPRYLLEAQLGVVDGNVDLILVDSNSLATALILHESDCDSGSTSTCVDAMLTQGDDDYWKGVGIVFTDDDDSIIDQEACVYAFDEGTDTLTFRPVTTQAVATTAYTLVFAPTCGGVVAP